jgi:hypothetical protein
MAMKRRSGKAWFRLLALGSVFLLWLALNAHTILYTSTGEVAWNEMGAKEHFLATLRDAPLAMHLYWLEFTAIVLLVLMLVRWRKGQPLWPVRSVINLGALGILTLTYIGLVGWITAKAGMAHPRYYIFVVPFVAVMMAMVFAQLRGRWLIICAAIILATLTLPSIQLTQPSKNEDFRGMTLSALRGSDDSALFLFPWAPNRDLYRVYLERFLGIDDARSRMVGVSQPQDAAEVCSRLQGSKHVTVLGHDSHKSLTDAVYASCGTQWPQRTYEKNYFTFSEQWLAL